jgi:ribosome-binding protein aMBF1 (putative translation factor)
VRDEREAMETKPRCQVCGTEVVVLGAVGRRDVCGVCGAELHACRQCAFYDLHVADQCREPEADKVQDKEAGNFCDFFRFSHEIPPPRAAVDPAAEARKRLDDLFKKKG